MNMMNVMNTLNMMNMIRYGCTRTLLTINNWRASTEADAFLGEIGNEFLLYPDLSLVSLIFPE